MMNKIGARALEQHDVTASQWAVIGSLARPKAQSGMAVNELASFLMVSRQNLAGVLQRLERRGYVERVVDEHDGRSRKLRLTPAGTECWQRVTLPILDFYMNAASSFTVEDQMALQRLLECLLASFRRIDEGL
ncbi:MarR family winged helix-turn-helix transcriptional regulator [Mesorhizobium sp. ANAO-SY3R2]|uniref:MarR family winged helix-turn-helix transcriptional regulator n=1 Tax=Mesorhizobium sp. ANAO-SY3R2 TaxID=3166644 RepID=UPI0036711E04